MNVKRDRKSAIKKGRKAVTTQNTDIVPDQIPVTERAEALSLEERLRQSEQRFNATFEQVAVGLAHIGLEDGRLLLVNQKFCDIVKYSREELIGKSYHRLHLSADMLAEFEQAGRMLRGEMRSYTREVFYVRKDGSSVWSGLTLTLARDGQDKPLFFVAVVEDITERKHAEQRTHDALNALLTMAESLVLKPGETEMSDMVSSPATDEAARQLARLTCKVLGCRSVGILSLDPVTDILVPVAVAGSSTEHKQKWWAAQQEQKYRLNDSFSPDQLALLCANEILLLDMERPQFHNMLAPYPVRTMLIAPMQVSEQLIGLMVLDFGGVEHERDTEEIALAKAVAKLIALVIEHKRLFFERASAQAGEMAQRAAKQRMEEFLGIASHELRSPLTTININIQVAERLLKKMVCQELGDLNQWQNTSMAIQDMLKSAERQVQMLSRLVGDLIDISRIQADKLKLHMRQAPCDLAVIVQEAVQNQRHIAPMRDINLVMSLPRKIHTPRPIGSEDALIPIFADSDRIGQVVTNYLTNAIKYSPTDRPIKVRLQVEDNQVCVSVRDEGPGLSPEDQEHIWERFYQANSTQHQSGNEGGGLGLGLHISRSIIERHQGQVGLKSAPGKGSTFWFILPLSK